MMNDLKTKQNNVYITIIRCFNHITVLLLLLLSYLTYSWLYYSSLWYVNLSCQNFCQVFVYLVSLFLFFYKKEIQIWAQRETKIGGLKHSI